MVTIVDWPAGLNLVQQDGWFLEGDTLASGVGLDGREQVVFRENRRWVNSILFVRFKKSDIPTYQAFRDSILGRATHIRLPICNIYAAKVADTQTEFLEAIGVPSGDIAPGGVSFSDGAAFSDGALFALPDYVGPATDGAQTVGASSLALLAGSGLGMVVGSLFSIDDFLYRIQSVTGDVVKFNPPLRAAVPNGTGLEVGSPTIRVRLANDSTGRLVANYNRWSKPLALSVIEAFDR